MSWSVDTPVRVASFVFAAIVDTRLCVHPIGSAMTAVAEKRPLMLLQLTGDKVIGMDLAGHVYEAEEIEYFYPTAIAQVRSELRDGK